MIRTDEHLGKICLIAIFGVAIVILAYLKG